MPQTRSYRSSLGRHLCAVTVTSLLLVGGTIAAGSLSDQLGRSETRVQSGSYPIVGGRTLWEIGLAERLDRRAYRRVRRKPSEPGRYFWGHERFWIYRRAHRLRGQNHPPRLFALRLRREDAAIVGAHAADGTPIPLEDGRSLWLEPVPLAESLRGDRAVREPVVLDRLPEHVWRPVLAAEDARFFDHTGLDGRSLARALLANARAGRVRQGGSTITQQLVKNRELTPKRTLGRKASEAIRALALEAEYDKREILESYLDLVYLGHVGGLAIHGWGTAARVYFGESAEQLTLAESALLAAMIQGPNRLSPVRHPERVRERRDWVLARMEELGWATPEEVAAARGRPVVVRPQAPRAPLARDFLGWIAATVEGRHDKRLQRGRGIVVETTLDPWLQRHAEQSVAEHLARLRGDYPRLRRARLSAALVALDARTGAVLAWVGGDPAADGDEFDRVRSARRQPGSAIKPFVLLEAFQSCGPGPALHPATRVADEPLRIDLPSGPWEPGNFDGRFHGVVDVRTALRQSYNVPFVRIARRCGTGAVAERIRRAGLALPPDPPPSFALGAAEVSPLELAGAFTVFTTPGRVLRPFGIRRVERPAGRKLSRGGPDGRPVVRAATAYLVRDLMRDAVASGTGRGAAVEGLSVAGKTGTSSGLRDAWFVGDAGSVVAVVWIGLDGGGSLGLTGGAAAAPLWRRFVERAAPARPPHEVARPRNVVTRRVDLATGLLYPRHSRRGQEELFRQGALPRTKRFWRPDPAEPVLR